MVYYSLRLVLCCRLQFTSTLKTGSLETGVIRRTVVSNNKELNNSVGHMDTNIVLFLNDGICQLRQCGYTGPSIELMPGNNWFEMLPITQSCCKISVILSTKPIPELVVISCFTYKFPDNLGSSFL